MTVSRFTVYTRGNRVDHSFNDTYVADELKVNEILKETLVIIGIIVRRDTIQLALMFRIGSIFRRSVGSFVR